MPFLYLYITLSHNLRTSRVPKDGVRKTHTKMYNLLLQTLSVIHFNVKQCISVSDFTSEGGKMLTRCKVRSSNNGRCRGSGFAFITMIKLANSLSAAHTALSSFLDNLHFYLRTFQHKHGYIKK